MIPILCNIVCRVYYVQTKSFALNVDIDVSADQKSAPNYVRSVIEGVVSTSSVISVMILHIQKLDKKP